MSASGTLELESVVKPTGVFPWWLVLIEGVAALIIGVLLLLAPQATLELVFQLFGLFWLVDGVLRLASVFTDPIDRGLKIGMGTIGVLAGIAVVRHPAWLAVTMTVMLAGLLGCAGITIGLLSIVQAFRGGGWGAAILGGLSFLFGLLVLFDPLVTGVTWVYLLYAGASLIGGLVATVMAFRLRKSSGVAASAVDPGGAIRAADPKPT